MKFSCEKAILLDAINICTRAVASKSTIPALEGFLITASKGLITLVSYNLETAIQTKFEAEIQNEGSIILSARFFYDVIRHFDDDMVVFESDSSNNVNIKCGMSVFNYIGMPAADFPALPEVDKKDSVNLEQKVLKSMISQTIFAVSQNESKPVHTGLLFDFSDNVLNVVAVDGFRLALRRERLLNQLNREFSFVVCGSALKEIERVLKDDGELTLYYEKKHIVFEIDNTKFITRLLEGEFLNYKAAIPEKMNMSFIGNTKALTDSIERVSLIVSEKLKSPVKFSISRGALRLSCITAIGKSYDECKIDGEGEIEIGFNFRFLLDALKAGGKGEVKLSFITPLTPCTITPVDDDSFIYLILPVRLKADG